MKSAIAALLLAVAPVAHATDCNYPFGDTIENITKLNEIFSGPGQWTEVWPLLIKVCRSKFNGDSRESLYDIGLSDEDIDTHGTARITLIWLTAMLKRDNELRLPQ